jgi:hypothetical protein
MNPEILKKYEGKTLKQIEDQIRENNKSAHESRAGVVEGLMYLRKTSRYKENPLYAKSSFERYLMGEFNMRLGTLLETASAYSNYPEESARYGVGLIAKVKKRCTPVAQRKVMDEIKATGKKLKKPITRDKIDFIIQKHAKPSPPAKETYKELYVAEVEKNQKLTEKYNQAMNDLTAANRQIEKLKATILKMRDAAKELVAA